VLDLTGLGSRLFSRRGNGSTQLYAQLNLKFFLFYEYDLWFHALMDVGACRDLPACKLRTTSMSAVPKVVINDQAIQAPWKHCNRV
jgi:hypothetical protein